MFLVSFYGKSPPTAKNGHRKHPKGNKPTHRPNYPELIIYSPQKSKGKNILKRMEKGNTVQG